MSAEMQIFYHTINSFVTAFYYFCLMILLSNIVDHKKQKLKTCVIYVSVYLLTAIMTETSVPVILKVYVQIISFTVLYRILLTKKMAAVTMHVSYFEFISVAVQENLIIFFCKINHIVPWVDVGRGVQLGKARIILISSAIMLVLTLFVKYILKPFSEIMENRNIWILAISGLIFNGLCEVLKQMFYRYEEGRTLIFGIFSMVGIAFVGMAFCIFFYRFLYLEKREREKRIQVELLERQFAYYRDKQNDEERIRSIYHDMKNHLLILEHKTHSQETVDMVEKLQQEMAMYTDYQPTGNDFLDVIIREKAKEAREKHITFSANISMEEANFIEPLDLSTIFGNALDNAIEASEMLPEGKRGILVKVGKVQNFLSIFMENNCQEEGHSDSKRSSKKDEILHGFGIANMKNAVEKYDGQLTTRNEHGKFTLKILIPFF